jgi:hypothetical protein
VIEFAALHRTRAISPKINICDIFGVVRFSTLSTASVKTGKAQREQMFSALALKPDIAEYGRHFRLVPHRSALTAAG